MNGITDQGRQAVQDIASRNGVGEDAVMALLQALQHGHGTAAQFNIRELGGMGQWSKGGMTQVGDMFNDGLKQKVNAMCQDLARLLDSREMFDEGAEAQNYNPSGSAQSSGGSQWWPSDLGSPNSTGGQNDMQYALFAGKHRLAVKQGGTVTVYDSGDHAISGFSQQQGNGGQTLKFSTQNGQISTDDLRRVD